MIDIKIEGDTIERITRALANVKNGAPKAFSRGINEALDRGRTECVRAATAEYLIKAGDVRASLSLKRASFGSMSGEIRSVAPMLPLIKFEVKPPGYQQRRKKKRPISARVKRGGGGGTIERGFLAPTGKLGRGAFERMGPERVPLKEFYTVGPSVMLGSATVSEQVENRMREVLEKEIERQAALLLSQA